MKKLLLFILLITTASGINIAFGQTAPVQETKIYINKKGEVHNHDGTVLGYISKDNIVKDAKGQKVYFIDEKGNVIGADGANLGKAKKNGDYYNVKGESVLTLKDKQAEECEILDPKGHNYGSVHKNYKLHACAAHCFYLKAQKDKAKADSIKKG